MCGRRIQHRELAKTKTRHLGVPFFFADPAPLPLLVTVAVLVDELDEVRVVVRGGGERETEGTCRGV